MKTLFFLLFLFTALPALADQKLDEAKRLMEAMRAEESYAFIVEQAKSKGQDIGFVLEYSEKISTEMAALYAEVYTEEEIIGIRRFFESEAGQAFLNKKPEMNEKYSALMQRLLAEISLANFKKTYNKVKNEDAAGGTDAQEDARPF